MSRRYAPLDRFARHDPRDCGALFESRPLIIGHRGGAGIAPENTYAAFDAAADLGVTFELDVHLSKDGVAMVIHDDTLDRTTVGRGRVDAASAEELHAIGVPTLDGVLERYADRVRIDIELKTAPDRQRLASAVAKLIHDHGASDRVFVTSFDPRLLASFKNEAPEVLRGQLVGTFEGASLAWYKRVVLRNLLLNARAEPDMIVAEHTLLDAEYVSRLGRRGYRVLAWTVNEPADMARLVGIGVDGLITDRPDIALSKM